MRSRRGMTQVRVMGMDSYAQRYVCEDRIHGEPLDVDKRAKTKAANIPIYSMLTPCWPAG